MASTIKRTGKTGSMLVAMAQRGGRMTADHRGFPPSSEFLPLRRRGLVTLIRSGILKCRYNVWHLTPKGWEVTGMQPVDPVETV